MVIKIRGFISRNSKKLMILLILIAALCFAAFYNGITVTEYKILSGDITQPIRIVLLTDLHSCMYGPAQRTLINKIDRQQPDIIVMAGDILDDIIPDGGLIMLLEGIANNYPCYYVSGNHEFWSGRAPEQKALLRSYGVTVLEGEAAAVSVNGQPLLICGVDDPEVGAQVFDEQLETVGGLSADAFKLLLSHRPERFETYADYDFDLVLCGHAHGGQWRIPLLLPNGLFAPNQGWFPAYTRGIHELNGTKMLVSRGLSRESSRLPRIFNAPEVVVVVIDSAETQH